jgi:hypothetical protein
MLEKHSKPRRLCQVDARPRMSQVLGWEWAAI